MIEYYGDRRLNKELKAVRANHFVRHATNHPFILPKEYFELLLPSLLSASCLICYSAFCPVLPALSDAILPVSSPICCIPHAEVVSATCGHRLATPEF